MNKSREKIVIIGGGFGGLNLVKRLDKRKWDITLIDKNNYHSFAPLLYQVASSGLEPSDISFPLRREVSRGKNRGVRYTMGTVSVIDVNKKTVLTEYEEIPYDKLIIAAGCTNNFFGINGLQDKVYTIKSVSESIRTRNAILYNLERASQTKDEDERRSLLTFAIIGAGPTGVEIAGALGEMKRWIIAKEYPQIDPSEVKVILYEGGDKVLRTMSERSSKDALNSLSELMVDVRLGKVLADYDGETIRFSDGESLKTKMVIWTAGITGTSLRIEGEELKLGAGGRFLVDEFNKVEGIEDVYAIGDISLHIDSRYPKGCPQLAQPAIQQAKTLAKNLNADSFTNPFVYKDKGSMATIGRNRAVVDLKCFHFSGFYAWITWMLVHLLTLLGMRNRAVVLINWIWSYFGFSSSLRMILQGAHHPKQPEIKNSDVADSL